MAVHRSLLRPLGIVGYDGIEPILLAALATEEPLLLVSDHGAAKTLLLVRVAGALGLELRHYNASLLQFDDLLGFPVPDERGGVRYAAPPGAIWGAEVAFFDEVGRCRPESANKLFPLIHERRLQGVQLDRLRYRWAATNPPAEALSADRADDPYEGVEPLDAALADRFSYIVTLPRFLDLSDADRMAVIPRRRRPRGAGRGGQGPGAGPRHAGPGRRDVGRAAERGCRLRHGRDAAPRAGGPSPPAAAAPRRCAATSSPYAPRAPCSAGRGTRPTSAPH
jgi:MoxR-like ATPase